MENKIKGHQKDKKGYQILTKEDSIYEKLIKIVEIWEQCFFQGSQILNQNLKKYSKITKLKLSCYNGWLVRYFCTEQHYSSEIFFGKLAFFSFLFKFSKKNCKKVDK